MKILRAYVLQEHLGPFFVTMGGLTVVLLVGNIIKFAELVVAKGVSLLDVLRLLIYLIPAMLTFTIPMACLVAMVLAFSRLSSDYELIAMRASGVAPARLITPIVVVGLVFSGLLLIINDRIAPAAHLAFRRQLKAIGIKQPIAYLEAGTFIKAFPPYVIFIYQIDRQHLDNVRIYEPQPAGPTRTIIAQRGTFEPLPDKRGVQLHLVDGTMDEWDPLHPGSFYKVSFKRYAMALRSEELDAKQVGKKLKEMNFWELLKERRRMRDDSIDTLPISLEFHRKIAASFAALVFTGFGLAFGLRLHHHERLISFVWILSIFLVYYLGTVAMHTFATKGWLPAWLAMWMPNLIGGAVAGALVVGAVRR